jgi:hypothetical protein
MVFAWTNLHHVCLGAGVSLGIVCYQSAFGVAALIAALNVLANLLPRKLRRSGKDQAGS